MAPVVKRVYEKPARADGIRVLVDRLWPRGLTRAAADISVWLHELAPSNELRKWYHENLNAWTLFRHRYARELRKPEARQALEQLRDLISRKKTVTLLFASTNLEHNNAVALKEMLKGAVKPPADAGPAHATRNRAVRRRRSR